MSYNLNNFRLFDSRNVQGYFQFPKLAPIDWIPEDLLGFNYVKSSPDYTKGVHFFLEDYQFERVWNSPSRYIDRLANFDCVLTPDFSLYSDMPIAMQIWNTYRSRLIGSYWQDLGMSVIPTVSWSTKESYHFCFDSLPQHSTLAISTVGVMMNRHYQRLFCDGLDEMIGRLSPKNILIWGKELDYHFPNSITVVYYRDTRLKRIRREYKENGWKR